VTLSRAVVAPSSPSSITISPLGLRISLEDVSLEASKLLQALAFSEDFFSGRWGEVGVDSPKGRTVLKGERKAS
jgi:hypothetical protein